MSARVLTGDCLDVLPTLDAESVDAIVTDPPYELTSDGKASAYRVFAEFMFPEQADLKALCASGDDLPLLVEKILGLRGVGAVPCPPPAMPVGAVALDGDVAVGEHEIEHAREGAVRAPECDGGPHAEAEPAEHLGCFALELADTAAFFEALDGVGTGFLTGAIGIGFAVHPANAPRLLARRAPVHIGDVNVGARDNALADAVRALAGAAGIPVTRLHLSRGATEAHTADGALVLCTALLLGGAKLVRADAGARRLPTVLEARRVRVVDPTTHRTLSLDLVVHPQKIAGVGFMGKAWDGSKIAYNVDVWREAYRVLKPGAHMVVFGGARTFHRVACAIEDAGFEIRDTLSYMYGSGFPKSLNVSKAIDKARDDRADIVRVTAWLRERRESAGVTNAMIDAAFGFNGMAGHWTTTGPQAAIPTLDQWPHLIAVLGSPDVPDEIRRLAVSLNGVKGQPGESWFQREVTGRTTTGAANGSVVGLGSGRSMATEYDITAPATDLARQWEGWGTALKPAWEPIILARKPLTGTVAANVSEHGTGGLNIDGCRIEGAGNKTFARDAGERPRDQYRTGTTIGAAVPSEVGRWPANVVLDEDAARLLDEQTGELSSGFMAAGTEREGIGYRGGLGALVRHDTHGDSGGASRFFYTAKASASERNAGLSGLPRAKRDASRGDDAPGGNNPRNRGAKEVANHHPTVKPLALMRWLCRLVTPPGGTILDHFAGSGSTGCAAALEGFSSILIEREAEYAEIIRARVAHYTALYQPPLFTDGAA